MVPLGGQHLLEGSLELRVPLKQLVNGFGVVLFADAGVVQLTPQLEGFVPSVTLGGGLRYSTLIGAIRVDLAFRLFPDQDRFPLQPSWALHLSIGEAF